MTEGRRRWSPADALLPDEGWYADFTVADDHVVVFAGRVFRYRLGGAAGRAEAVAPVWPRAPPSTNSTAVTDRRSAVPVRQCDDEFVLDRAGG